MIWQFLALLQALILVGAQTIPIGPRGPFGGGGGGVTWTLVQKKINSTCTVTGTGSSQNMTCTANLNSATTAGNLLIALSSIFGGLTAGPTLTAMTCDSTWTHFPAQYESTNNTNGRETVDGYYILSATGGATNCTIQWTGTAGSGSHFFYDLDVLEIHRSTGSATFDAPTSGSTAIASCTGACATFSAPSFTITGSSDYCVDWVAWTETITSFSGAGYTNPADLDNTNVVAAFYGALNQSSVGSNSYTLAGGTASDSASAAGACWK